MPRPSPRLPTASFPVAAGRRFASLPLDEAKLPGGRAGLFQITLTGEKKTKDGWGVAAIAAKRVLVTDTALIAKTSRDGRHVVHAADLVRGVPAAGLRAVLLGANGVPLETVTTDETGAARFATTRGLEREKAPAAVVVTNEATGDLAWLSLSDASNVDHDHDFSTAGRLGPPRTALRASSSRSAASTVPAKPCTQA